MRFLAFARSRAEVLAFSLALATSIGVPHPGFAKSFCGGIAGLGCGPGTFCQEPAGTCGKGDIGGHCVRRPDVCSKIFLPVCGCNGKTYGNDCERKAAGVSLLHERACGH